VPNPPGRPASNRPTRDLEEIIWKGGAPPELNLGGTVLFYPGVGSDWQPPVKLLGPWINTFVFVDRDLSGISDYLSRSLLPFNLSTGRPRAVHRIERSVINASLESGRNVEISWLQMDALEAIEQLDDRIGIFFYRGDSSEGSNLWWLFHTKPAEGAEGATDWEDEDEIDPPHRGLFHKVLGRLADGALIVTDGSKGDGDGTIEPGDPNSYSPISSFLGKREITPVEAMNESESFRGPLGHSFECVGCISPPRQGDKGPVLIWQVRSPSP